MPPLYGKPRKDELRDEIRSLRRLLGDERKESRRTRRQLQAEQERRKELEHKLQGLERKLSETADSLKEFRKPTPPRRRGLPGMV
jgi:septal ring factor EnvC (AmiA/AmiB activator)